MFFLSSSDADEYPFLGRIEYVRNSRTCDATANEASMTCEVIAGTPENVSFDSESVCVDLFVVFTRSLGPPYRGSSSVVDPSCCIFYWFSASVSVHTQNEFEKTLSSPSFEDCLDDTCKSVSNTCVDTTVIVKHRLSEVLA